MRDRRSRSARRAPTRRQALIAAGAGALAACTPREPPVVAAPSGASFRHGVASGDPLQDRVILWTRVSGAGEGVDVSWRIARDESLRDVVAEGAARAEPERDWTVKVDADGLAPGSAYFYAFEARGVRSPVGRTRTLPEGPVERFAVAVVSCANHPAGFFNVYREIADRGDADVVLHLGDYLYEGPAGGYATGWGRRNGRIPDPPHEIRTLADYRRRHAQYKEDQDLQAAHAAAPWILAWDDHETADNAHAAGARSAPDATAWSARRTAAIRAYMEWTPIREPAPGRAREAIWRSFEVGDLATLVMLETRLTARSPSLGWWDAGVPSSLGPDDPGARDGVERFLRDVVGAPEREMLGAAQEAEVEAALTRSVAAGKPWQILGNQTIMAPVSSPDYDAVAPRWLKAALRLSSLQGWAYMRRSRFRVPLNLDQWDGYPAARERLYAAAGRAGAQLITLSGDTHTFMVNRLVASDGREVGVELGTSAVSSPSAFANIPDIGVDFGALTVEANPHILHHNAYDRGYTLLTLTPAAAHAELRRVDTVEDRNYRAEGYKSFEIVRDETGALDVAEATRV